MSNFRQKVEIMGQEDISTTDYETKFKGWVYNAVGDFLAAVATENSSLHAGLMVDSNDAGYQDLVDTLPPGAARRATILANGSLRMKNDSNVKGICTNAAYKNKTDCEANSETWSINDKFFVIKDGVFYEFVNRAQVNLFYHQIIKKVSLEHLSDVQALDPNSKRAALITKMQTDYDHDKTVFASDANAAYTSNLLNDPIRLEDAYQKRKVV